MGKIKKIEDNIIEKILSIRMIVFFKLTLAPKVILKSS